MSNVIQNKCDNCGANLEFDAASGTLKCGHCSSITVIAQEESENHALTNDVLKEHGQWTDSSVFRCENCGAKEVLNKKDISGTCAFCGSARVIPLQEISGVKPDSVIPFQIDEAVAYQRFGDWLKKRRFAPNEFKRSDPNYANMKKVYTPNWLFNSSTSSSYSGWLTRDVTTTDRDGNRTTTTESFRVSGYISQDYNDIIIQSGGQIPNDMFEKIKPFNLSKLKAYKQEFLSGIMAEHYSRDLDTCFKDFQNLVEADLRSRIIRKHNADGVSSLTIRTIYNNRKFAYILLPVFVAHYTYKGKLYNFFVNGENGRVAGKYPKSAAKILLLVFGIIAAVGAIVALAIGLS